jgi:isoamylase
LIDGRAQATGIHRLGQDATLLLLFNAYHEDVPFTLPATSGGDSWTLLLDSNRPGQTGDDVAATGSARVMTARSLAVFGLAATDEA